MGQGRHASTVEDANKQLQLLLAKLPVCRDTSFYYTLIKEIVCTAIWCDSLDAMPNAKGKVRPKYRHANSISVGKLRRKLVEGGLYYYRNHADSVALTFLQLHINTQHHPLFNKQNRNTGLAELYAGKAAYGIKNYRQAEQYADMALQYSDYAKEAAQLKIYCMKMLIETDEDAHIYINTLQALHEKDKHNLNYTDLIIQYYSDKGLKDQLAFFVNNELATNKKNKMLWALKGEYHMTHHEWQQAIDAFDNAVELDSVFIPAIYNIGICYVSHAIQLRDSLEQCQKLAEESSQETMKSLLKRGQVYLEKAQQLDPLRHIVDWAPPLYQVYYALADERADEIKKLIKY